MNTESDKSKPAGSENKSIDQSKRSFAKAGLSVPVIMTLAGKPIVGFGAPCLSQMMSGNLSNPGDSCSLGNSPGGWKTPGGETLNKDPFTSATDTVISVPASSKSCVVYASWGQGSKLSEGNVTITFTVSAHTKRLYKWAGGVFDYGYLESSKAVITSIINNTNNEAITQKIEVVSITSCQGDAAVDDVKVGEEYQAGTETLNNQGNHGNSCDDYTGGSLFSVAFGRYPENGVDRPMRQILCEDNGEEWHFVAAMLNAHYYSNYVLSVSQVKSLYNAYRAGNLILPPGYSSINQFLDATWAY